MVLQAIKYERRKLRILDQLRLPHEEVYLHIKEPRDAFSAIKSMQVRGAPAIAIVAALSLAVALAGDLDVETTDPHTGRDLLADHMKRELAYLVTSRPTAVNLADAARKLTKVIDDAVARPKSRAPTVREAYIRAAEDMLVNDVRDNEGIGGHGALWIERNFADYASDGRLSVLTHCNTGSLATAGYGTALGVVRSLHARGVLKQAFYTETRPYNQGSRLTGYELIHDNIPATLITDSMAAALFNLKKGSENISAVVVGADRVAANGDTANKIGTYSLAILARYHGIKFLVAAPRTTIDLSTPSGKDIVIEERASEEVTNVTGTEPTTGGKTNPTTVTHTVSIAAIGTHAWNPAFDVTPAELIDGIVTEYGVVEKENDGRFHFESLFREAASNPDDASSDMEGNKKDTDTTKDSSDQVSFEVTGNGIQKRRI